MSSPPTAVFAATAGFTGVTYQPFVSGVQQAAYDKFQFRGGVFVRRGAAANNWDNAVPSVITGQFLALNPAVEFESSSPVVAFGCMVGTTGSSSLTVWVSTAGGTYELVQATPFYHTLPGGNYEFLRLTFDDSADRKFKFELAGVNGFYYVRVNTGYTISKPATDPKRVIVLGDSITQPTGTIPGRRWDGWAGRLSQKFPALDVWQSGAGGTGYVNANAAMGQFKIRDRLQTDAINFSPDMIVWALGINDTNVSYYGSDGVYNEAVLCYSAVRDALPNCVQVVFGPWWPTGSANADALAVEDQLRRAAADFGLVFIPTRTPQWITTANEQSYHPTVRATGTAALAANAVASVSVANGGSGYQVAPAITFAGGGGTGAAATAVMDGRIESISLLAGGGGYVSPTVSITGGGGTGATATATVVAGVITAVNMTNEGTGYNSQPTVTITDSAGSGAVAVAAMTFKVASVTVTNGGSGYTSAPTVTFAVPSDGTHPTGIGHGFYSERAAYEMLKKAR